MSKVQHLLRVAIPAVILLTSAPFQSLNAQELPLKKLSAQIQKELNKGKNSDFSFLLSSNYSLKLKTQRDTFLKRFPNTQWTVRPSEPLKDGRKSLEILIKGHNHSGINPYFLEAKQKLAFNIHKLKVVDQEVISEYSILSSSKSPLPIRLVIPDAVLTGTRYDIDLIFDEPLGDAIIAGGLIALTAEQFQNQKSPSMQLEPMGGGGLFKSVVAPSKPGKQTWSAMLAHPDGLISITKTVRVVSNQAEI